MNGPYIIIDISTTNQEQAITLIKKLIPKNESNTQATLPENNTEQTKTYTCNNPNCKKTIDKAVVAFCLRPENKERFQGKVYCRTCQEDYPQ